jgi:methionyl-tRNA formyltransferase
VTSHSREGAASRPRALFFGTPAFAATCLDALVEVADVVTVVAQPDKPAGRGMVLTPPPTKVRALELGIPVLQPTKVKPPELHDQLRALRADFALVVAYGRILPKGILSAPLRGCVNVHASLLPRWRGAAPIQWAIRAGDAETGICLMEMDEGLDTGAVFAVERTPIADDETSGELFERLAVLGATMVRTELVPWWRGERPARPQDPANVTLARMLTKDDGALDFGLAPRAVHDQARSMTPWPGAHTTLFEEGREPTRLRVHGTRVLAESTTAAAGTILGLRPFGLAVACAGGVIALAELQQDGKKRVPASAFVSGRKLSAGARMGAGDRG